MCRQGLVILSLLLAFASGVVVEHARSQAKPRMWAEVLLNVTTREIPARTYVHANLDHWQPGAETGRHTHPGPTLLVVLEGELEETVSGNQTRRLAAGQAFWHPARREHNVKNVSDRPARALAVHLDPAG